MNLDEIEMTPVFVLRGLFLVLAVVWMLLPEHAVAFSNFKESSSFVPFSGCADFAGMAEPVVLSARSSKQTLAGAFSSATELRAAFTPCEDEDRDSDPQYNICFEGNPAPISTLPHLLAGLQAELASTLVLNTAAGFLETQAVKTRSVSVEKRVESALGGPGRRMPPLDRGATCSTSGDQCSALPGLPGSIELASGVPVMLPETVVQMSAPDFLDATESQQELWARLRVGDSVGHGLRLDRPPIEL